MRGIMRESAKQEIYDIGFEFHDEFASRGTRSSRGTYALLCFIAL